LSYASNYNMNITNNYPEIRPVATPEGKITDHAKNEC